MKTLLVALALVAALFSSSAHAQTSNRFLASVPADSPYVFASLQPMPDGLMATLFESFDGFEKTVLKATRDKKATTPEDKLARALLTEFKGKFNRKGLESFGLSLTPQVAIYGLGPLPVARIEVRDGKKVRALFGRVMKKAGIKPPVKKSGGKEYFLFGDKPGEKLVVAIQERELAAAIIDEKVVDAVVSHIFGTAPVPNPMTDGKTLSDIAAKHKFTPYGVGYGDFDLVYKGVTGQLTGLTGTYWAQITAGAGAKLPAACKKEITDDIKRFPRVVIGYDRLDKTALGMSLVLEGDSTMVAAFKGITAEVPGFHPEHLQDARLAFGGAMKIPEAKKLGLRFADALDALGKQCAEADFSDHARNIRQTLNESLPPQLLNSSGAYMVGIDFDLPEKGMVENVAAYVGMQTKEPTAILAELEALMQGQVKLKVPADGKFHQIKVAMVEPFMDGMFLATDAKHIFLAAGTRGKSAAEKAKAAGTRSSPFIYFGYDMAYILKKLGPTMKDQPQAEMMQSMSKLYKGPGALWLAPSPHGLALSTRMALVGN